MNLDNKDLKSLEIDSSENNDFLIMLVDVIENSPKCVIVSEDLFKEIEEEVLLYALGHFYISVKNVLNPFCPFYLNNSLPKSTYILCKTEQECDFKLLELNYLKKNKDRK